MREESTRSPSESRAHWEDLEEWVRGQIQGLIQELLEEEITELLGRAKSARRSTLDGAPGYRNGYGKPRRLTLSSGTIQVRRPRVRNVEERFERRVLPLFARKSKKVADLIPELYLHALAEGDFDLALRGLLGDEAPVSASTVARLKEKWHAELAEWRQRPLDDLEVVYMWVDGVSRSRPAWRRRRRPSWWCWRRSVMAARSLSAQCLVTGSQQRAGPRCCEA